MEVCLGAETQLELSVCVMLTMYFLPPPPKHLSADLRRELYIMNPEEEFPNTQCCCHKVLLCIGLHCIIIIDDISLIQHPMRQSKLTLFLGCHYACC
jgi:hypothetical protein